MGSDQICDQTAEKLYCTVPVVSTGEHIRCHAALISCACSYPSRGDFILARAYLSPFYHRTICIRMDLAAPAKERAENQTCHPDLMI